MIKFRAHSYKTLIVHLLEESISFTESVRIIILSRDKTDNNAVSIQKRYKIKEEEKKPFFYEKTYLPLREIEREKVLL